MHGCSSILICWALRRGEPQNCSDPMARPRRVSESSICPHVHSHRFVPTPGQNSFLNLPFALTSIPIDSYPHASRSVTAIF